jgi:hypothetical protein
LSTWLCAAPAARWTGPLRVGVDRIERGQHLAGLHVLAFLDQHFAHLAGDLGRDRRHAARDDVAGRVEHRGAAAVAADRCAVAVSTATAAPRWTRPTSRRRPAVAGR